MTLREELYIKTSTQIALDNRVLEIMKHINIATLYGHYNTIMDKKYFNNDIIEYLKNECQLDVILLHIDRQDQYEIRWGKINYNSLPEL